jgi:hypothetical protein
VHRGRDSARKIGGATSENVEDASALALHVVLEIVALLRRHGSARVGFRLELYGAIDFLRGSHWAVERLLGLTARLRGREARQSNWRD